MKKLLSVFLSVLLSICFFNGIQAKAIISDGGSNLDRLLEQYSDEEEEVYWTEDDVIDYEELYFHTDESGAVDWILVKAELGGVISMVIVDAVVEGVHIYSKNSHFPFAAMYGIYDVKQGKFFDLTAIQPSELEHYDGLYDAFRSQDLSGIVLQTKVGDANGDGQVGIVDATFIQRYVADMIPKQAVVLSAADVDGDEEVSSIDVTLIQRNEAMMCNVDGSKPFDESYSKTVVGM